MVPTQTPSTHRYRNHPPSHSATLHDPYHTHTHTHAPPSAPEWTHATPLCSRVRPRPDCTTAPYGTAPQQHTHAMTLTVYLLTPTGLQFKASNTIRDYDGLTPLEIAKDFGQREVAGLIQNWGQICTLAPARPGRHIPRPSRNSPEPPHVCSHSNGSHRVSAQVGGLFREWAAPGVKASRQGPHCRSAPEAAGNEPRHAVECRVCG